MVNNGLSRTGIRLISLRVEDFFMLMHSHPLYRIYFGDARDEIFTSDYLNFPQTQNILDKEPFSKLKKIMGIDHLIFLHQVHGTKGLIIEYKNQAEKIRPFSVDGDYIITNVKDVGIGVVVADCLPIILFDKRNQVLAIVHAGWRSSVEHIAIKAVDKMQKTFGTKIEDIRVTFGPSAKVCCYKVGEDFLEQLQDFEFVDRVVQRRSDGLYFDLPMFNMILLKSLGIKNDAFKFEYNDCTVCDESFYSHRRNGDQAGRNMVVASLT